MPTNLSVESIQNLVQGGDAQGLISGRTGQGYEGRVLKEMRENGMDAGAAGALQGVGGPSAAPGVTFSDLLRNSVEKVNEHQVQADTAIKELVAGRHKNVHETMLAVERADSSLKLMMTVRNKILDAYREIMRMQV
jgi:flagellar hook-basal body complex protein FliE